MQKAFKDQQKAMQNVPANPGPGNAGPGNPPVKIEFPGGLGQKDPGSVADALNDLRGTDNVRQDVACRWLAKQPVDPAQQPEVAKALGNLLGGKKNPAALSALKTWATKDNVPEIAAFLDGGNPGPLSGSQEAAMETLGRLADERGVDSVARYVTNFFAGETAARSLQAMGPAAEKAVLRCYNDPDSGGRDRVHKLLQGYGTKDVAIALQCAADMHSSKLDTRKMAADWLAQATVDAQIQPQVAKELEANLKDSDWGGRARTVRALGVWGTADNVPGLAAVVQDPAPQFGEARVEAIAALGKLKDERGVPALIVCLDKDWDRQRAGQALIAIGPPAEKELLKYVGDPASNRGGVMEAQQVLKKMGSKENATVTLALTDLKSNEAGRRREAAERLSEMPAPDKASQADVAKALTKALEDPDEGTRERAAKALIVWATPDSVPALLQALDSKNVWVRRHSMEALGKMKEESAAQPIAAHLVPGDDRQAASKALQLMVGTKAENAVIPYLLHNDEGVVIEACRVLQAIGTKSNKRTVSALDQIVKAAALRKKVDIYNAALAAGQAIARR
jgi:HEAT repeat protein